MGRHVGIVEEDFAAARCLAGSQPSVDVQAGARSPLNNKFVEVQRSEARHRRAFSADPVTRMGLLTVPSTVSPGCSGFGQYLTFPCDSSAGNGRFGIGWSFALPMITRKTRVLTVD